MKRSVTAANRKELIKGLKRMSPNANTSNVFLAIEMTCGCVFTYTTPDDIPENTVHCKCGNIIIGYYPDLS